jgi:hypothetical protein
MAYGSRKKLVGLFGALCVVGVAFAGLALYAHFTRSASSPAPAAAGNEPIVAVPPPAVPPTPVAASGPCSSAMGAIRAIQHHFASGSLLDERANRLLTADLVQLDRDCSADLDGKFRARELTPWLTYLPPGAGA